MYRAELGSLITVWEAGFLPPGQRRWSPGPLSLWEAQSAWMPRRGERVPFRMPGGQAPKPTVASFTQCFGGGGRHLEMPSPYFHPGTLTLVAPPVELIFLTCMPSSRPQYPEFSQEREKVTRTMGGRGKCLALGCLFVWKRLVPPDGLPVPQGQASPGFGA